VHEGELRSSDFVLFLQSDGVLNQVTVRMGLSTPTNNMVQVECLLTSFVHLSADTAWESGELLRRESRRLLSG
jgi:hypothetical protein